MKDPKYYLWERVGFEGEIWEICGFSLKFCYGGDEWNYFLKELEYNQQYTKTKSLIPEVHLTSPESILEAKIKKAELEMEKIKKLANDTEIDLKKLKKLKEIK